jgi:hypothetical protein
MAPHSGWRSSFSRCQLTEGGSGIPRDDSIPYHLPLSGSRGRRLSVSLQLPISYVLVCVQSAWIDLFILATTHDMKDRLEPLHLVGTARCASRGFIPEFGEQCLLVFKNKELKEEAKKGC